MRMERLGMILAIFCVVVAQQGMAEQVPETTVAKPADKIQKKAAALISDLDSNDFGTRESAEKALKNMDASILPQLKKAVAETDSAEVKIRAQRVIDVLSLTGENDPDALAKLAREKALAKSFGDASKLYAKAAKRYSEEAGKTSEEAAKKGLEKKAAKASEREKRALALAGTSEAGDDNVIKLKEGKNSITIQLGGGGPNSVRMVSSVQASSSSSTGKDGKGDW